MLNFKQIRIFTVVIAALLLGCAAVQVQALSDRQKGQLKSALIDMKRKTDRERDVLRKARMDLFLAYQSYDMDERKVKILQAQISESQLKLLNIHLDNQLEIRDILSESQFSEFQRMMKQEIGSRPEAMVMPPPEDAVQDKYPDIQMIEDLKLGTDQRRRMQPLIGPGSEKMKVIERLRNNAKQMIGAYSRYNLDTAGVKKLIASIHENQQDLASLSFKRQQTLRQVLTEDQFKRLMGMVSQKLREHQRPVKRR